MKLLPGRGQEKQKEKSIMNDLNINMLRTPSRSLAKRFLGILYLLLGLLWILSRIIFDDPGPARFPLPFLDIIYIVLCGISGFIFLIESFGISISSWFGEAYIRIDNNRICIKKGVFLKEWVLLWSDVEQINFSVIRIEFSLRDKSKRELNYDYLEYEHIQAIKQSVRQYGFESNIPVKGP